MNDSYSLNTKNFPIDKFREILKTKNILPGRVLLKEQIDQRFDLLKSMNIQTLFDLLDALKSKSKIEKLAEKPGLSVEYLTLLRREANSYLPIPVKLTDLPYTDETVVEKLEAIGFKDSRKFFNHAASKTERTKLAQIHQLSIEALNELLSLCDLIRITGVGPVFARIIYDSGIHSVKEFLSYPVHDLHKKLTITNEEKKLTKVKFALNDIEYCTELGKELPLIAEI